MNINVNELRNAPTYIGDDLVASFDGWQIWLTTQDDHRVALEPKSFESLVDYAQRINKGHGGVQHFRLPPLKSEASA